jgi:hypothetical protein
VLKEQKQVVLKELKVLEDRKGLPVLKDLLQIVDLRKMFDL